MSVVHDNVESMPFGDFVRPDIKGVRGRYAPSPTGELHLGNASTALLAWLSARSQLGRFVMRVEDLDGPRVREGAAQRNLADLIWLGLDWDEGPDLGGPFQPYEQSQRFGLYDEAFRKLRDRGRLYPCFCSRRDIAMAASAPQAPGDEVRYPGICRDVDRDETARRIREGARHAWRFRVEADERPFFNDVVRGPWGLDEPLAPGDFVVRRTDGTAAYQLAVVVDDAQMNITEVVRGDDLLPSTARQLLLFESLGLDPPRFAHVPLLIDEEGHRLSKRQQGITLAELRDRGVTAQTIVGRLAVLLGLRDEFEPVTPRELLTDFSLSDLPEAPEGIPATPHAW